MSYESFVTNKPPPIRWNVVNEYLKEVIENLTDTEKIIWEACWERHYIITPHEIARMTGRDNKNVSGYLRALEKKGLLYKFITDGKKEKGIYEINPLIGLRMPMHGVGANFEYFMGVNRVQNVCFSCVVPGGGVPSVSFVQVYACNGVFLGYELGFKRDKVTCRMACGGGFTLDTFLLSEALLFNALREAGFCEPECLPWMYTAEFFNDVTGARLGLGSSVYTRDEFHGVVLKVYQKASDVVRFEARRSMMFGNSEIMAFLGSIPL